MTKREYPILVLSPRVRGTDQVREYRPLGGRPLLYMMRDVAAALSDEKSHVYGEHVVFTGFFFGRTVLDERLLEELQAIGISLVECGTFKSAEAQAVEAATKALLEVGGNRGPGGATTVLACADDCGVEAPVESKRVEADYTLFAVLWMDLAGRGFRRVGEVMARRWGG